MPDLTNKVAIVSGGATLIGWKTGEALRDSGAKVVLADIADEDGERIAGELGADVIFCRTDVTEDDQIEACLAAATEAFGGVDFLVNVACTYLDKGVASTREEWLTALNVNLVGGAVFAQKAVPLMRARGGGAIVNFGSISGKRAQPERMLYSASKAAVIGMTRNLALALAPDKIRVNSVSPGWTWSNVIRMFSGDNRAKADSVAAPFHPIGRLIEPDEVAAAVAFLCSDEASGITGTDIAIDGGYTAMSPEGLLDQTARLAD